MLHRISLSSTAPVDLTTEHMEQFYAAVDAAADATQVEAVLDDFAENLLDTRPELEEMRNGRQRRTAFLELRQTLANMRPAPREVSEARLAICRTCEHARRLLEGVSRRELLRCAQCGCLMNAKVRLKNGRCPTGKFE